MVTWLKVAVMLTAMIGITELNPAQATNYAKMVERQAYGKMESELDEDKGNISSEEDFFYCNFWRAVLYYQPGYSKQNPLKAYNIFINLQRRFIDVKDPKVVEKINKKGIDNGVLTDQTDSACHHGLMLAEKANTMEAYDSYMKNYELAHPEYRDTARNRRDAMAYKTACLLNTEDAYANFIATYPYALQRDEAQKRLEEIACSDARKEHSTMGYGGLLARYPQAACAGEARDSLYKLAYIDACTINTSTAYAGYAETFPDSPYRHAADSLKQERAYGDLIVPNSWSSYVTYLWLYPDCANHRAAALDSLLALSQRQKSARGLLFYLEANPNCKRRELIIKQLYPLMAKDGELSTLNRFKTLFPQQAQGPIFDKDMSAATYAESLDLRNQTTLDPDTRMKIEKYIKMAGDKDQATVALQVLIRDALRRHDYAEAKAEIEKMRPYTKGNASVGELLSIVGKANEQGIETIQIGNIKSGNGNEYYPIVSADGKRLYFCGRDRDDNLGGEDVYVTERDKNGNWSKPAIFAPLSAKESNDGILAVSADGTSIIKFENGVMGVCDKTAKGWQPVRFFPEVINRGDWNSDATFCADGSTLLFASIRPSASSISQSKFYHGNNHYESDLYVSHRDSAGNWSEPVNLGPTINTIYSERSPFMHPDMKTLYFSSDGRGGLGGYDVYKSERLSDTCWTCWSTPVNLGKEINTPDDDWTYKISTDGATAYFSKKEAGTNASEIYSVNLPKDKMPYKVVTISGKMENHSGEKVVTNLVWEDLETKKIVGRAQTDPDDGSYFIVLPVGKLYGIYVDDSTVYPETRHVDLREVKEPMAVNKTFHVTTLKELKSGAAITINNIFFDFGKSDLLTYSYPELRRLAGLLKKLKLRVEISGHTDNVGADDVNMKLSEDRALAVKNFLVKAGCNANSIDAKGYGKTKPVADNDTEEGRARNRRVEMKVIK